MRKIIEKIDLLALQRNDPIPTRKAGVNTQ